MYYNCLLFLFFSPDINECVETPSVCEQSCTNTVGSFVCGCNAGFELQSDGRSCNGELCAGKDGNSRCLAKDLCVGDWSSLSVIIERTVRCPWHLVKTMKIIDHPFPNYHPISCHASVLKQVFVTPLLYH